MSLSSLPHEVLVLTFQHLDSQSLKSVRLLNKSCSLAAAIHLFHTIHLRPLHRSWRRIDCISTASHLQKYVKAVHLNTDILDPSHGQPNRAIGFRTQILQRSYTTIAGYTIRTISESQIDELFLMYTRLLREQVAFESIRPTDFRSVLTSFANLKEIKCRPDGYDHEPLLSPFILQSIWLHTSRSPFRHFYRVCMSLQVESLMLSPLPWDDMLYPFTQTEQKLEMTSTRVLKLCLNNEIFGRDRLMQPQRLKRLKSYLSLFSRLETLSLAFDSIPRYPQAMFLERLAQTFTSVHFRALKHLSLSSFNTEISPLVTFLNLHSPTLLHLHLEDIAISSKEASTTTDNSIMGLFVGIHDACTLSSVTLSGTFTNLRDEGWEVRDDKKTPDCLCVKLENYMTGRGQWPIAGSPSQYQSQRLKRVEWLDGLDDAAVPETDVYDYALRTYHVDDAWQDLSWQWAPHLLPV